MKRKKYRGQVVTWKTEKGYGFVSCPFITGDLFLHINDIRGRIAPNPGDSVKFRLTRGKDNKLVIAEARLMKFSALSTLSWITTCSLASLPFILSGITFNRSKIPLWLYSTMSIISFIMIKIDKERAKQGLWRIPDTSLHLSHLFGGWPGTLISQKVYLHKANKKPFQGRLNFIIFIHGIIWLDYMALDHIILRAVIRMLEYFSKL